MNNNNDLFDKRSIYILDIVESQHKLLVYIRLVAALLLLSLLWYRKASSPVEISHCAPRSEQSNSNIHYFNRLAANCVHKLQWKCGKCFCIALFRPWYLRARSYNPTRRERTESVTAWTAEIKENENHIVRRRTVVFPNPNSSKNIVSITFMRKFTTVWMGGGWFVDKERGYVSGQYCRPEIFAQ